MNTKNTKKQFLTALSLALFTSFVFLLGANRESETKQQPGRVSEFLRGTSPLYSALSRPHQTETPAREEEGVLNRIKSSIAHAWQRLTNDVKKKEAYPYYPNAGAASNARSQGSYNYYGYTDFKKYNEPRVDRHKSHNYYSYSHNTTPHRYYNYYSY